MSRLPFSLGTTVLGAGALLLLTFLGVGFILPGTWTAERSGVVHAPPEVVYALVDAPEAWRRWTSWPDSGLVVEGPERGVGARMAWNDTNLGDGAFEIVTATPFETVRYHVAVQDGAMQTDGTLRLDPSPEGTRVAWREDGDFGRNPLMGYWARFMARAQGAELEKSLARLDSLASAEASGPSASQAPAEADSSLTPAGAPR